MKKDSVMPLIGTIEDAAEDAFENAMRTVISAPLRTLSKMLLRTP